MFYIIQSEFSNVQKILYITDDLGTCLVEFDKIAREWAKEKAGKDYVDTLKAEKPPTASGIYVKYETDSLRSIIAYQLVAVKESNWIMSNATTFKETVLGHFKVLEAELPVVLASQHENEIKSLETTYQHNIERQEFRLEKQYEQIITNYKITIEDLRSTVTDLESCNESLYKKIDTINQSIARKESELQYAEDKCGFRDTLLKNLDELVKSLQTQIVDLRDKNRNLQEKLDDAEEHVKDLVMDIELQKKHIEDLKCDRQDLELESRDLRTKMAGCFCQRTPVTEKKVTRSNIKKDISVYNGVVEELKARFDKSKISKIPHPPPFLPSPRARNNDYLALPPLPPVKSYPPIKPAHSWLGDKSGLSSSLSPSVTSTETEKLVAFDKDDMTDDVSDNEEETPEDSDDEIPVIPKAEQFKTLAKSLEELNAYMATL